MSALPKRPGPYLLSFLLIILAVLTAWLFQALTSEELREALARQQSQQEAKPLEGLPAPKAMVSPPAPSAPDSMPKAALQAAPAIVELTAALNAKEGSIEQDLEILKEVLRLYTRVGGGPPTGLNEEIAAALTGQNEKQAVVLPADHSAMREGALVDRWGTPFWFHPVSAALMEIRSAGPDRELFTSDDVVANDSGVTGPKAAGEATPE